MLFGLRLVLFGFALIVIVVDCNAQELRQNEIAAALREDLKQAILEFETPFFRAKAYLEVAAIQTKDNERAIFLELAEALFDQLDEEMFSQLPIGLTIEVLPKLLAQCNDPRTRDLVRLTALRGLVDTWSEEAQTFLRTFESPELLARAKADVEDRGLYAQSSTPAVVRLQYLQSRVDHHRKNSSVSSSDYFSFHIHHELLPVAKLDPKAVSDFIDRNLSPVEAIPCYVSVIWHNQTNEARQLLVRSSEKHLAGFLNAMGGYDEDYIHTHDFMLVCNQLMPLVAKEHPELTLKLIDQYLIPLVLEDKFQQDSLSPAVYSGIDALLSRVKRVADAKQAKKEDYFDRSRYAIQGAFAIEPEVFLKWFEATNDVAARDKWVAFLCRCSESNLQYERWLKLISKISDPEARTAALLQLNESCGKAEPPVPFLNAQEISSLRNDLPDGERDAYIWRIPKFLKRFAISSVEVQLEWLKARVELGDEFSSVVTLIENSNLPRIERVDLVKQFSKRGNREKVLAATFAKHDDLKWSLDTLYEMLPTPRKPDDFLHALNWCGEPTESPGNVQDICDVLGLNKSGAKYFALDPFAVSMLTASIETMVESDRDLFRAGLVYVLIGKYQLEQARHTVGQITSAKLRYEVLMDFVRSLP